MSRNVVQRLMLHMGCVALVLGSTSLLLARPVTVRWQSMAGLDTGCVERRELSHAIEQVMGRDVFVEDASADVVLNLELNPPTEARVTLFDGRQRLLGRRRLSASDCAELDKALVLALSLMLDFRVEEVDRLHAEQQPFDEVSAPPSRGGANEPAPEATTTDSAKAGETEAAPGSGETASVPSKSPAEGSAFKPRLTALALAAAGFSPRPNLGFGVAIAAGDALAAELDGAYFLAQTFERQGGNVELTRYDFGLSLCPVTLNPAALEVRLCGRGSVGRVRAVGTGFARDESAAGWLMGAGLGVGVRRPFGAFLVEARAAVSAPLRRHRVVLGTDDAPRRVFQAAPVLATLGLGVGWRFH